MRLWQSILLVLAATLLFVGGTATSAGAPEQPRHPAAANDPQKTCPVTRAPQPPFVPPAPYPALPPGGGQFWFGTRKLWTWLPNDGTWRLGSAGMPGFPQKLFWWREGYWWRADPAPVLRVTGKRLDAPAPDFVVTTAGASYREEDLKSFMIAGVDFPTVGCWKVTGRFKGDELTFVVLVEDGSAD